MYRKIARRRSEAARLGATFSRVRRVFSAAVGAFALAAGACSASSTPATEGDAATPDASATQEDAAVDAQRAADADAAQPDASVTAIVLDAATAGITDGGTLHCGPDYDGVVVFYAAAGATMPTETGLVSCASPVVLSPVEPGVAYQLDVYVQKAGAVVAQAACTAMTHAGESVTPTCALFM